MKPEWRGRVAAVVAFSAMLAVNAAGTQSQLPDAPAPQANQKQPQPQQNPPDAPQAQPGQSGQGLPIPPGGVKPAPRPPDNVQGSANPSEPPAESTQQETTPSTTGEQQAAPAPPAEIRNMPRGKSAKDPNAEDSGRDEFTIAVRTNLVVVPVTVKDSDGRLVDGLQKRDFSVYEDNVLQNLRLFTSDPFPLSAAVVIDQAMSDTAMKRVNETLPSLAAAFSGFDEVALYTYGNSVRKVSDFATMSDEFANVLKRAKRNGRTGGVAVNSGPLAAGPTVNGHPLDPGTPHTNTAVHEDYALNDAIFRAAQDLGARSKTRRKIIFIVSDGQESGSSATYSEVLKVLLSNEIQVFAVGVDSAAIPGYGKASRVHIPGFGYGNLLPKYVAATGGDYFTEFTRDSIEQAYAQATEQARNQYTLGYQTRSTAAGNYRSIEVRVKRPGLRVYAKDGYYPLPPPKTSASPTAPEGSSPQREQH